MKWTTNDPSFEGNIRLPCPLQCGFGIDRDHGIQFWVNGANSLQECDDGFFTSDFVSPNRFSYLGC